MYVPSLEWPPAYGPMGATQQLKLEMKDFWIDKLIDKDVSSDSTTKDDHTCTSGLFCNTIRDNLISSRINRQKCQFKWVLRMSMRR